MDRYVVKYTVNFRDHRIALEEEMEVETDGPKIARAYIKSLYEEDESNVVEIPQSILDSESGYGETDLFFDGGRPQYSWYHSFAIFAFGMLAALIALIVRFDMILSHNLSHP